MVAGERLNSKVYPLVTFQIMVAVEALRALIALERPVIRARLGVRRVTEEMGHCRRVSTVKARHHPRVNSNQRKLTVRVLYVGEDRCRAWLIGRRWRSLVWVRRVLRVRRDGRHWPLGDSGRHSGHRSSGTDRTLLLTQRRRRSGGVGEV